MRVKSIKEAMRVVRDVCASAPIVRGENRFGFQLPKQSRALVALEREFEAESAVGFRPHGNGKRILVRSAVGCDVHAMNEAVKWTLAGAQVTLISDQAASHAGDVLCVNRTDVSESVEAQLVQSADVVVDSRSVENDEIDVPQVLACLRLLRPQLESKQIFDIENHPGYDLLNFLEPKPARAAEQSVHEFLEVLAGLDGMLVKKSPVCFVLDPRSPIPDHVIIQATLAAINPLNSEGGHSVHFTNQSPVGMHATVERFLRHTQGRLGFSLTDLAPTAHQLCVVGRSLPGYSSGVANVDSDPFRLASQHVVRSESEAFKNTIDFSTVNCKATKDDNSV